VPTTKLTPFVVSEDEWHTKDSPGKSMKNGLYVYCSVPKGTFTDEATSNSKKTKSIVLAVIELCLSVGIS